MQDEGNNDHLTNGVIRVGYEDGGNKGYVNCDGAEDRRNEVWSRTFSRLDVEEEGDTEEYPYRADDGGTSLDVLNSERLHDGNTVVGVSASEVSEKDA